MAEKQEPFEIGGEIIQPGTRKVVRILTSMFPEFSVFNLTAYVTHGKLSGKTLYFLGYQISPNGFSPNQKTQKKALEKAKQHYAQGDRKSLHLYLHRWSTWVHAVLPFKVQSVKSIVASMVEKVTAFGCHSNSQRIKNRPPSLCVLWA